MLLATQSDVVAEPFPHVIREPFLEPELFDRLAAEFPKDALFESGSRVGGRSGRDLYRGDPEMDELLRSSPAWKELHDYINSPAYLEKTLELFSPHLARFGSRLEPDKMRFVDYAEPREVLVSKDGFLANTLARWRGESDPHEIFCRLDIHQGGLSYAKPVHCDRANRLVSMILYLTDSDEIESRGGELLLYSHRQQKPYRQYERHPRPENTTVVAKVRPRRNLGVFFLCTNNSYHGVAPIDSQRGYRNFAYINLSSRARRIW